MIRIIGCLLSSRGHAVASRETNRNGKERIYMCDKKLFRAANPGRRVHSSKDRGQEEGGARCSQNVPNLRQRITLNWEHHPVCRHKTAAPDHTTAIGLRGGVLNCNSNFLRTHHLGYQIIDA
jgi:hypothetical protein